jgi:hypothetical protein
MGSTHRNASAPRIHSRTSHEEVQDLIFYRFIFERDRKSNPNDRIHSNFIFFSRDCGAFVAVTPNCSNLGVFSNIQPINTYYVLVT